MAIDQDLNTASSLSTLNVSNATDEELLIAYRKTRDQSAFSELVHRHERELRAYLCRHFGDETLAEDALQMTFFRAHLNCEQFQAGRRVRPWLYAIATNSGIDILRRRRRRDFVSLQTPLGGSGDEATPILDTLPGTEPLPSEHLTTRERILECREAVMQLPERLRVVVELFYFEGLKYREAAEVLSVPIGTVKSRIHDALNRLRTIWNQEGHERREALSVA